MARQARHPSHRWENGRHRINMKIVVVGSGNVGHHLAIKLQAEGLEVVQVFSRQAAKARALADRIGSDWTADLGTLDPRADLYLLAVNDDALFGVASSLALNGWGDKLVAHTSGATPLTVFSNTGLNRFGVFYPLQSFSLKREPDFQAIPFCIDAKREEDALLLEGLARQLSQHVARIDDAQRAKLHLAAVFVNNFTNHLYSIGHQYLGEVGLDFGLLLPLIRETVAKLDDGLPSDMQTGPAIRNDQATIARHLAQLQLHPGWAEIYRAFTEDIQRRYLRPAPPNH